MRNILKSIILFALLASFVMTSAPAYAANDSIQLKSIPGDSALDITRTKLSRSWPWYLTRASGLIAGFALIILLLSGIGLVTGHTFKLLEPLTAWATHRSLGITFVLAVLVHVTTLLFDHFIPFTIPDILVPWLSQYQPVTIFGIQLGSLYVALGVLALYLSVLIVLTSIFWIDKKPKVWKVLHISSYVLIAMVFFHALFMGTDTGSGLFMWIWVAMGIGITIAALARLRRVNKP